MSTHEETSKPAGSGNTPTPPSYAAAWDALDAAKDGPLQRLHRLQSLLCTLCTALERQEHQPLDNVTILHLSTAAHFAYEESCHVDGDLERFMMYGAMG